MAHAFANHLHAPVQGFKTQVGFVRFERLLGCDLEDVFDPALLLLIPCLVGIARAWRAPPFVIGFSAMLLVTSMVMTASDRMLNDY